MKKISFLLIMMPLLVLATPFHTKKQINEISSSVIKIYTTSVQPDYYRPWQKGSERSSSGTGVIIEGNLILTAAHVVDNGTFIQVKKSNDAKKYMAQIKWIAHEADLALLEVEDSSFFENVKPRQFGGLPYRQDGVVVYGYPMGGDEISTTQGIVSRIEHTIYSHGYMDHLTLQIDAPINPGNSGGPAFDREGKIVGIAIETIVNADGIGYLVPVEVISHFFKDIEDGVYDGYPDDGIGIQALENENIKDFYRLENRSGVLVSKIHKNSSAEGIVKIGDVILEVDGVDVAGDNTVKLRNNGRVSSNYLVRTHQVGDIMKLKVLRENHEMLLDVPMKKRMGIVRFEHDKEPRFYMFGGMVFTPLTINYLKVWGKNWYKNAPFDFLYALLNQSKFDKDIDELVVLGTILPNRENANYNTGFSIVTEVNGIKVTSLQSFVKTIEESKDKYINILLASGSRVILEKEKALQSDIETMKRYGVGRKQRL